MELRKDQQYLPMRVNDPQMVIFWDVDEVRPIIISMALGVPFDLLNYAMPLGIAVFLLSRRLKQKYAKGIFSHLLWWHGLLPLQQTTSMPDPLIRELFR